MFLRPLLRRSEGEKMVSRQVTGGDNGSHLSADANPRARRTFPVEPAIPSTSPNATPDPDVDAIGRILDGDTDAFGEIVSRHERRLRHLVRGLVSDAELVDDVLQEVFFNAYRALPHFRGDARLSTWLYRIAVRESSRARLRLGRWRKRVASLGERDVADPHRERSVENEDELRRAHALLDKLPSRERAAFVLYVIEDRSYAEIADILEAPAGTVASWIHRARAKLDGLADVHVELPRSDSSRVPPSSMSPRRDCT